MYSILSYRNVRVTFDGDPNNARSESDLAVNPLNPANMVGSSKRFTDIASYAFSLAAYATFDGGLTWTETILSLQDTNGTTYPSTTDPAVAFDDLGNAYIVALPWRGETGPNKGQTIGISIYRSTDGGLTWSTPVLIHWSTHDDKQAVWGDTNLGSPFKGNVYTAWDDTSGTGNMLFARTTDHGTSWKGITQGGVDQPAGTPIPNISDSFSPEITVASDGTVLIVWAAGDTIKLVTSNDGGSTFSSPSVVASGITNLSDRFQTASGFPIFPGAKFRVITYATNSTNGNNLVVVWADAREGVSRIYYRVSPDGGTTWNGPSSGQPLLTGTLASGGNMQDFHPQVATTPDGLVGCVFYEYGPVPSPGSPNLINVFLAISEDHGATFTDRIIITNQAWDPSLDAPNADANPAVKFIGDYFGLAASVLGFFPFWTDTRTGVQEIWTAAIPLATMSNQEIIIRLQSAIARTSEWKDLVNELNILIQEISPKQQYIIESLKSAIARTSELKSWTALVNELNILINDLEK